MCNVTVGRVYKPIRGVINVVVDRTSALGNPFYMKHESMRDEVCDKYAAYFESEVMRMGSRVNLEFARILEIVKSGMSVNLQCHCAPKRCHADTIKQWLLCNIDN